MHEKIWIERVYENMVAWFERQSIGFHRTALFLIVLFLAVQVAVIWVNPPWLESYPYTPVLWVVGLLSYLIAAPFVRYSKVLGWYALQRAHGGAHMKHWAQRLVIFVTFLALVVEVYGIATGNFTISAVTRDFVDANTAFYWVFGLLAGVLAGLIVDLRSLPELIKLCCVTWVAVLAHICWWITQ